MAALPEANRQDDAEPSPARPFAAPDASSDHFATEAYYLSPAGRMVAGLRRGPGLIPMLPATVSSRPRRPNRRLRRHLRNPPSYTRPPTMSPRSSRAATLSCRCAILPRPVSITSVRPMPRQCGWERRSIRRFSPASASVAQEATSATPSSGTAVRATSATPSLSACAIEAK